MNCRVDFGRTKKKEPGSEALYEDDRTANLLKAEARMYTCIV
jgi:hypothetical protein